MAELKILTETTLRELVPLDLKVIQCVENAFRCLAVNKVVMPPILRLDIPAHRGEVDVKAAHVEGWDKLAVKVASGFFDNPKLGLASSNGLMILISASTGLIESVLLDNGYLTDIRTAAAGAVSANHLAVRHATIAAVMGAGMQAHLQLKALALVRPIKEARLWARDFEKASRAADMLSSELGFQVSACEDPQRATKGAHVIITTTPAESPIVHADWIEPGQHITAMGSDAEHKNEIDPQAIALADIYVADDLKQTRLLGELHHAIRAGTISPTADLSELGEIVAGRKGGRTSDMQITIADLTGTGIQDTAIANLAFERAEAVGGAQIIRS
jgi:ornithine cyclodeaminase